MRVNNSYLLDGHETITESVAGPEPSGSAWDPAQTLCVPGSGRLADCKSVHFKDF